MIDLSEEYKIYDEMSGRFMGRFGDALLNVIESPERISKIIRHDELDNLELKNKKVKHIKIGRANFKGLKGEKFIKSLEKKIKNNEEISNEEIVKLTNIAYSNYKTTVACLYKRTAKIIRNIERLTDEEIEAIEYEMCLIYGRNCTFKDYENMENILKIGYPSYDAGMKSIGTKIAISLLKQNVPIPLVYERAKLPIEYIEKLAFEI